ncbi:hypothetical protein E1A91_D10G047300v1 [Gossypium mustelinum]|uniref:F-box domain-containing protein n=3 Tax=Gossypium TaxID=3633 RepID=A0A5J5PQE9_GOSBA|nr:hypothetical protein ES319_D10G045100v1 [Gossypium barbadense]TYG48834.1 hypothetical protein ES288_D10G047100v1 [Gossypium darwinii]TYI59594.1 hypothetical protein E1A91_D10G047300v1 [Gossypium mustelinum]KAB2007659.1 hypothetical protein ES319_D10G045100v1 [Gossypium barbadense]KAB2007660.1 hypothetical protein ES319_D10G045100v1 [Gossypium barbadense]
MRLGKGFQFELYLQGEPLIPGLPDDVALNCLLRLPVECHTACKAVCKRWHFLLGNKERFFTSRKELGFKDPWLFVLAFQKCTGEIEWQVLDLTNFSWHSIPTMPCKDNICPHGISCVSFPSEGALFVCGGMMASDVDSPLDLVFKYEIQKNNWTVMKKMNTARSFFASGVINGMIYVAGGNSADLFELDSAEVMDPAIGNWHPVASMGTNMASYDSAVFNGKLLVTEGWLWPFFVSPRGRVYDPITNTWENMALGLREGWTGSSVVVYGHLFVVSEHERMKLKVYYPDNDSWETTQGPPLPEQICKPFAVNAYDNIIYVIGRYLHVAMGYISKRNETGSSENKWRFSVEWQVIDGPKLSDLTPSTSQRERIKREGADGSNNKRGDSHSGSDIGMDSNRDRLQALPGERA